MKKGFTLIEVTAVILLLALLTLITVPKIRSVIASKKEDAYNLIVDNIEDAAKTFAYMNINAIDSQIESSGDSYVSLSTLIENKLIKNNLVNPITNEKISPQTKVVITKTGEEYIFNYDIDQLEMVNLVLNLNQGNLILHPKESYAPGSNIVLGTPTRENYEFEKWEVIEGDSTIRGNSLFIGTHDTILKAHWLKKVLLTINLDGGTLALNSEGLYSQKFNVNLGIPTRENYTFMGWEVITGNGIISGNRLIMGTTDMVVKAQWETVEYEISYNCNTGRGETFPSKWKYGNTNVLSPNQCYKVKKGTQGKIYYLKGWSKERNATTVLFSDEEDITNYDEINDNIILYAIWDELFDLNGNYEVKDDDNGNWRVKIKGPNEETYGQVIIGLKEDTNIDIFLVGGGGGGGGSALNQGGGGGGGYTKTKNNILLPAANYTMIVGSGGLAYNQGESTIVFKDTEFEDSVIGGYQGVTNGKGGNGGSGGGGPGAGVELCSGGSDGGNGKNGNSAGGTGQGTTTREFAEADGTLYAGGGVGSAGRFAGGIPGAGGGGAYNTPGQENTGGGGGSFSNGPAAKGGSGIIVIRNAR